MNLKRLQQEVQHIFNKKETKEETLQAICNWLESNVSHYDWVGFYFNNGDKKELRLAQFAGAPTQHIQYLSGKVFVDKWP